MLRAYRLLFDLILLRSGTAFSAAELVELACRGHLIRADRSRECPGGL
jgi:hypothetical protein